MDDSYFFLELLSEEIPARMQTEAERNLSGCLEELLENAGFNFYNEGETYIQYITTYSTPRRLVLYLSNLPDHAESEITVHKGPRVDAPQPAIDGFCKRLSISQEALTIEEDKKGKFYVLRTKQDGRYLGDVLEEIVPEIIRDFYWKKSMRWGEGDFRWVRPLHSIAAIFNGDPLIFEVGGITSGKHWASDFGTYNRELYKKGIIIDAGEREEEIETEAKKLCKEKGLTLIPDYSLLKEITGLVESPYCIMGQIDKNFLDLPKEVLQTSMKAHQKFLSVANSKRQITHFITVANKHNPTEDVIDTIRKGNERVLSARLADAKFFWENDQRIVEQGMKPWMAGLEKMTFHNKLGTQADKVARIITFTKTHAELFGVNAKIAETTAKLMKLDLCSEMVGEFPELQGTMGKYYTNVSYSNDIALACEEHYAPLGRYDITPTASLSVALAIADKLDTLAGFWSVGLTPTSSKDPFALRRAALGVIRLILDNELRLFLPDLLSTAFKPFKAESDAQDKLLDFFKDRLKIYLMARIRHSLPSIASDTIDACLLGFPPDDLTFLYNRARALQDFREKSECENLLQGFKRAYNILNAEQKKDGVFYEMPPESQYFTEPCEDTLFIALEAAEKDLLAYLEAEQFVEMLRVLADLREPIDTFFETVQVNSKSEAVRRNRLCLLHKICSTMKTFADFSLLNG